MHWECKVHQQLLMGILDHQRQRHRQKLSNGSPEGLFQPWLQLIIQQKRWWCRIYCQIHNKQTGTEDSEKSSFMVSFSLLKCKNHASHLAGKNLTFNLCLWGVRVCVCVCVCARTRACAQSCLTLWNPVYWSPGSSVHGILQARILEWVAMASVRVSSQLRDRTLISYVFCTSKQILYH